MKTIQISTRLPYRDPLADEQFNTASDTLLTMAQAHGQADGIGNVPTTEHEFKARFIDTVHAHIQGCLNEHAARCQNVSGVIMVKGIQQATADKLRPLRASVTNEKVQLATLQKELNRMQPDTTLNPLQVVLRCGLILISSCVGVINYPSFRAASMSVYYAFLAAETVAAGVAIGAPLLAAFIKRSKSLFQKIARLTGVHLLALFFFFSLGILRLHSYTTAVAANAGNGTHIAAPAPKPDCTNVWAGCLTSFFLFSLALFACIKYRKMNAGCENDEEYNDKKTQATLLDETIRRHTEEIAAIEAASRAEQSEAQSKYKFAVGHQRRLISLGERALATYCATNLQYRSDGLCPDFFAHPPAHEYTATFLHNA